MMIGSAIGCLGGVLIGEGSAQRAHQQDLHQFLQLVIDSNPAWSQMQTESGSGTQVFLIGSVPDEAARRQLQSELHRRFGERQGQAFISQVEVAGHSAPASTPTSDL